MNKVLLALKVIKNKVFSVFPVIGCHMGIEAELLLAGQKPLGWISLWKQIPSPEEIQNLPASLQKELEDHKRLDAAVEKGQLISRDVIVYHQHRDGSITPSISRHYAQPWNAKNLELMAAFNQRAFNRQCAPNEPEPDFGKLLGYRLRDRLLWEHMGKLPPCIQEAIIFVNKNITRDAYQADAVRQANKAIQKAATTAQR